MLPEIIHRSEIFWQEIVFVLIYIFSTKKIIHESSLRRCDKSEFFPYKNKHFYIFYLQNFVNYFFSPTLMFIDIKSSIIYRISCSIPHQNKQPFWKSNSPHLQQGAIGFWSRNFKQSDCRKSNGQTKILTNTWWSDWKWRFERLRIATKLFKEDDVIKISTLLYTIGGKVSMCLHSLPLTTKKYYTFIRDIHS